MVRSLLCEAANVLLTRVKRWSWLKRWGVDLAVGVASSARRSPYRLYLQRYSEGAFAELARAPAWRFGR
jgi:hypothetical protein